MKKKGYVIIIAAVMLLSSVCIVLSLSIDADARVLDVVQAVDERRMLLPDASDGPDPETVLEDWKTYERMDRQAQRIEGQQQRILERLERLGER